MSRELATLFRSMPYICQYNDNDNAFSAEKPLFLRKSEARNDA
jgi:hypothetical protein